MQVSDVLMLAESEANFNQATLDCSIASGIAKITFYKYRLKLFAHYNFDPYRNVYANFLVVARSDPCCAVSGQSFVQAAAKVNSSNRLVFAPRSLTANKFSTESTENKDSKAETAKAGEEESEISESERKLIDEHESLKMQHADLMDKYRLDHRV